jgi:hypothetical protein
VAAIHLGGFMGRTQRGITLTGALAGMIVLAFLGLLAAKLLPAYLEYFSVMKVLRAMEAAGDTKGTVREIRNSFEKRNMIEGIQSIHGDDFEVTKDGGETVMTGNWSVKVPIIYNVSACIDFTATTAK